MTDLKYLHASTFQDHVNSQFKIQLSNDEELDLTLVQVDDLTQREVEQGIESNQEKFTLIFHGPREQVLEQKIYIINHKVLGEFSLFIVPVGQTASATQYEVIFNRIIE